MQIIFDKISEEEVEGFYGGQGALSRRLYCDGAVKVMRAVLPPASSIGEHTHTDSSEVIYCLSGSGTIYTDGVAEKISAGMVNYCPKGHTHTFVNDSDADIQFVAVVPVQ